MSLRKSSTRGRMAMPSYPFTKDCKYRNKSTPKRVCFFKILRKLAAFRVILTEIYHTRPPFFTQVTPVRVVVGHANTPSKLLILGDFTSFPPRVHLGDFIK